MLKKILSLKNKSKVSHLPYNESCGDLFSLAMSPLTDLGKHSVVFKFKKFFFSIESLEPNESLVCACVSQRPLTIEVFYLIAEEIFTRFCYILPALFASLVILFSGTCYIVRANPLHQRLSWQEYRLSEDYREFKNIMVPNCINTVVILLLKLTPDGETRGLTINEVNLII